MLETTLVTSASALQQPSMTVKSRSELTAQPISLTEMSPVDSSGLGKLSEDTARPGQQGAPAQQEGGELPWAL